MQKQQQQQQQQQAVPVLSTAMNPVASAAAAPPPPASRLENTVACLPIVCGSVAFYLGKKADENNTHQWTLYLRGPNNEDLSGCIEKVVFQLHASFAQPLREITAPPYEVTERGWGEFEAQIRITWKDPNEKSTYVSHGIKLYPPGTPSNAAPTDTETPVVAESYDEVVFTNPTETFYEQLQRVGRLPSVAYTQAGHFPTYSDTEDSQALLEANKFVQRELNAIRGRLKLVDEELRATDEQIRQAQERQKMASATTATNRGSSKSVAGGTGGASTSSAATKKN